MKNNFWNLGTIGITLFLCLVFISSPSNDFASAYQEDHIFNINPAWSPDGGQIAFASNRSGEYNIWVVDIDEVSAVNLTDNLPNAGFSEPVWSPDGKHIAFSSGRGDIWLMDFSGANPANLTENESALFGGPQWSPTSSHIAFGGIEATGTSIWLFDLESYSPSRLMLYENGFVMFPKWSPDSKTIAAILTDFTMPAGENISLVFIDVENVDRSERTSPNLYSTPLDWSPDGKYVVSAISTPATENNAAATQNVVLVDRAGLEVTYLTRDIQAYEPLWSPDGRFIAFHNYEGETLTNFGTNIRLLNVDDNSMIELIGGDTTDESNPVWSPDSQQIAFERTENGVTDIWIVNVDGSDPINLTENLDDAP